MAMEPPAAIDVLYVQFKLHSKSQLFQGTAGDIKNCSLLTAASVYGLVIIGCPTAELKVVQLSNVLKGGSSIPARSISLPSAPHSIALSCDHALLAVHFLQNGMPFITIYSVPSFMSTTITTVYNNVLLTSDNNVCATELLWNPVIANTLAVCLDNGALIMMSFSGQSYELHTIDKQEQVRCASWSPKGKQIVVGLPNGQLAQYKPDLKLARTIPCTANVFAQPFDVVALQWLSNYQFAAVFLRQEQGSCPSLFIVNAPKNLPSTYINYDDICYSLSGPRAAKVYLEHILPWNLILVGSANSMEIGVLGTSEGGDSPLWTQYTLLDEARPELPLSADKQETYPIGMALETGCTHTLTINETPLPVMPMLHLLSTIGTLISFDIINKTSNCPGICSPPAPLSDTSGINQFRIAAESVVAHAKQTDVGFGGLPSNVATSTPTQKPKPPMTATKQGTNLFGGGTTPFLSGQTTIQAVQPAPAAESTFTAVPKQLSDSAPKFQTPSFAGLGGGIAASPFSSSTPSNASTMANQGSSIFNPNPSKSTITAIGTGSHLSTTNTTPQQAASKPFMTVAPTYTLVPDAQQPHSIHKPNFESSDATSYKTSIVNAVAVRKMLADEMQAFEIVFKDLMQRSRRVTLNFGTKQENEETARQLNDLQTFTDQATESTEALTAEIQSLRISLDEAFSMATEAKSKHEHYNNADLTNLWDRSTAMSQTNRRELNKLEKLLATNEQQFRIVSQQIDAQWSVHQDNVRTTAKAKMYVPQMENIYSTLSGQRAILNNLKSRIKDIKTQIGFRDLPTRSNENRNVSMNVLTDSIFSMSLCDQVKQDRHRLSTEKVAALRALLAARKNIPIVRPMRPDRKGVNSEVVIEKKLAQIVKSLTIPATSNADAKQSLTKESIQSSAPASSKTFGSATSSTQFVSAPKVDYPTNPKDKPAITMAFAAGAQARPATAFAPAKPLTDALSFSAAPPFSYNASVDSASPIPFAMNFNKAFGNNSTQSTTVQPFQPNATAPISTSFGFKKDAKPAAQQPQKQSSATQGIFDKLNMTTSNKENTTLSSVTPTPKISSDLESAKLSVLTAPTQASVFGVSQSLPSAAPPVTTLSSSSSTASIFTGIQKAATTANVTPAPAPTIASSVPSTFSSGFNLSGTSTANQTLTPAPLSSVQPAQAVTDTAFNFTSDTSIVAASPSSAIGPLANQPTAATTKSAIALEPLPPAADNTDKLFQSLNVCKPAALPATPITSSGASIFSGSSFTSPKSSDATASIFGGSTVASPFSSSAPFGTQPVPAVSIASPFGSVAASAAGTSIFGGSVAVTTTTTAMPKPEQSVFASVAATPSVFGGQTGASSTANVFSSSISPFASGGGVGGSSIFGGSSSAAAPTSPFGGGGGGSAASPFGGGIFAQAAAATANVFKAPTASESPASGTSIFGGSSAFGSTAAGNTTAPATSSIFGGGGGGSALAPSAFGGGSVFGGGSSAAPSTFGSSIFGGSTGFGAPASNAGGGSFMQGGSSILQTGFAAPVAAVGGATAPAGVFGGPPAFGAPSFGGAATFGSPKGGFGSFGQSTSPTAFTTQVTQKNSLFETLGSTENAGPSFGNLAQNSTTNSTNPSFTQGSSFSSWR